MEILHQPGGVFRNSILHQPGAFLQDIDFQFFAIPHQPGAEFLPLLEYKTNTIVSYTKDCVQKSHPHLEILASNLGLPVLQLLLPSQGTVPDSCLSCEYSILREGFVRANQSSVSTLAIWLALL